MSYVPLQNRLRYHGADMELVALFYEVLSPDITWQPEFHDYRTALYRSLAEMKREFHDKQKRG